MKERRGNIPHMVLAAAAGTALELLGLYIAQILRLPLQLGAAGVCFAAYWAGPVGGALAGAAGALAAGSLSAETAVCALIGAATGLIFAWCAGRGYLDRFSDAMVASFLTGLFSVAAYTPVRLLFSGGRSGNMWGDALFDMLDWYGAPRVLCALAGSAAVEIVDKQVCVALAFLLIRGAARLRARRRGASGTAAAALLLAALLTLSPLSPRAAAAETGQLDGYAETIYDLDSGMASSEANAIEETPDGCIWIGSYAGLTRYDGQSFELIHVQGIASVTALFTDRDGRLWIGTNDGGAARYENGQFTFFNTDSGMPVNSVRSFAQGEDGILYIGTTDRVCSLNENDELRVMDWGVDYVNSMVVLDGVVVGATNGGEVFAVAESGGETQRISLAGSSYYTCVASTGLGLLAGTSGGKTVRMELIGGSIRLAEMIETGDLSYITRIGSDSEGRVWLCAYNGMGFLQDGALQVVRYDGFDDSVECAHEDYQGNLWFASSRCGVMKLSRNRFTDLFSAAGVEPAVTNAVTEYHGRYYCGTDDGLVVLDRETLAPVEDELTERLAGVRIRSLFVDSGDGLWLCTYSGEGLMRYDGQEVAVYNAEESGAICDRFRCAAELTDGTIAAGASEGIDFIRNGEIAGSLTQADGLANPQILCLLATDDGGLYAGTDGAGLYLIRDGGIVRRITTGDGLTSDVILRVTAYDGGYFVVTSNCLCYMDADGSIRALEQFPYFNNFDLLVYDGLAYVLSSSGIFAVDAGDLKEDAVDRYDLYNPASGLRGDLTSNAWRYVDDDGTLFFCCNNGVTSFSLDQETSAVSYKFGVASLTGDGEEIYPEDTVYTVPAGVKRIVIRPSLRNYTMNNVKLRFYIDGMDDAPLTVSQSELEPIQLTNLSHGTYAIHMQIFSEDGASILQEQTFTLRKEAQVWENTWYVAYLLTVCVWMVSFLTWVVIRLVGVSRRKKELEVRRKELEDTVELQTREIRQQAERQDRFQWSVIEGMACLIEDRDGSTGLHVINTRTYVSIIGREMLRRGLHPEVIDQSYVDNLVRVAPLHDVGKIRISDVILNKPGRFTPGEFEQMKLHTVYGGEVVDRILGRDADPAMRQMARDMALCHHERWDGGGYPRGLRGEDIPLCARIMAVADVFDALVARRVYKESMPVEQACRILAQEAGSHFDPEIVSVFLDRREAVAAFVRTSAEAAVSETAT